MKKRKLIILGVFLILIMCMFTVVSNAADTDDFVYTVEDGCAVITDYKGAGGDVIIPSTLDGYKVSRIGNGAFFGVDTISAVTVSDGISHIDESAFSRVSATQIILPDSLVSIGDYAFENTEELESIVLPDSIITLGDSIFYGSGIKKITLPSELESIPDNTFNNSMLTEITIPDSVISIGSSAFEGCALSSITIPASVSDIGKSAFYACNLIDVSVHENNKNYSSDENGVLFNKDKTTLIQYPIRNTRTTYVIPNTVTSIERYAFLYAGRLKSVTIPNNMTVIGKSAFEGCGIESITIPDSVTTICERAFLTCEKLKTVTIGEGLKKIEHDAFTECNSISDVYYNGNKIEWECINIAYSNTCLTNASIHFSEPTPHSHFYVSEKTKANLTKNGTIKSKCSCGDSKTTTIYYPKTITLSATEYTYNKKTKTPTVTVKDSKGNTLKKDTDYTVSYEDGRKYPGKYTVKITFKGNYEGTKRLYFTIAPRVTSKISATQTTSTITLKWEKVTGAEAYRIYKYNTKKKAYEKLKDVTSTSLKISKLSAGTAYKYKVRAITKDDGSIYGESSAAFETATKCKTPSITKLTASKGKASFTWSNVSGESGFQVYYSAKKGSGYKKVASYKANVLKGSKSKLTKGKTYYFKVRAYKKTDSGTVYSSWSSVKSVKVK